MDSIFFKTNFIFKTIYLVILLIFTFDKD